MYFKKAAVNYDRTNPESSKVSMFDICITSTLENMGLTAQNKTFSAFSELLWVEWLYTLGVVVNGKAAAIQFEGNAGNM